METLINITLISFTCLIILIVEKLIYKRPPSLKKISDYQQTLNQMDQQAKNNYGFKWQHDAFTEITQQRKEIKSWLLIGAGFFLTFCLIASIAFNKPSIENLIMICINALLLILYGIIKMAESKKLAIGLLTIILILSSISFFTFNLLATYSPYLLFYLYAAILIIGLLSLKPKKPLFKVSNLKPGIQNSRFFLYKTSRLS